MVKSSVVSNYHMVIDIAHLLFLYCYKSLQSSSQLQSLDNKQERPELLTSVDTRNSFIIPTNKLTIKLEPPN
jgi:hypothetical protein